MRAAVIHVMEEGCIVESASHKELLRSGGRYAESWAAQMGTDERAVVRDTGYVPSEKPRVQEAVAGARG